MKIEIYPNELRELMTEPKPNEEVKGERCVICGTDILNEPVMKSSWFVDDTLYHYNTKTCPRCVFANVIKEEE